MGNLWGDLWEIMMTEQVFVAQRHIDDILVQIQSEAPQLEIQEIRISKWTQILFEREKPILLSDKIYLLGNLFVNI